MQISIGDFFEIGISAKTGICYYIKNKTSGYHVAVELRVKAYISDIRYVFFFQSDLTEFILNELKRRDVLLDQKVTLFPRK